MTERDLDFEFCGIRVKVDPDLAPDTFWLVDDEGMPLGIGTLPEQQDTPNAT